MVPANCKRIFNTGFQVQVAIDGSGSGASRGGDLGGGASRAERRGRGVGGGASGAGRRGRGLEGGASGSTTLGLVGPSPTTKHRGLIV